MSQMLKFVLRHHIAHLENEILAFLYGIFYATSLSSIPIKEEVWTIVRTASTLYK
jgi:hypothetical protein